MSNGGTNIGNERAREKGRGKRHREKELGDNLYKVKIKSKSKRLQIINRSGLRFSRGLEKEE